MPYFQYIHALIQLFFCQCVVFIYLYYRHRKNVELGNKGLGLIIWSAMLYFLKVRYYSAFFWIYFIKWGNQNNLVIFNSSKPMDFFIFFFFFAHFFPFLPPSIFSFIPSLTSFIIQPQLSPLFGSPLGSSSKVLSYRCVTPCIGYLMCCDTGNWSQGIKKASKVLCHWATHPQLGWIQTHGSSSAVCKVDIVDALRWELGTMWASRIQSSVFVDSSIMLQCRRLGAPVLKPSGGYPPFCFYPSRILLFKGLFIELLGTKLRPLLRLSVQVLKAAKLLMV